MLIDITNTCHMGCPHCMQRATPDSQHMSNETFWHAKQFAKDAGANVILVSGGEPSYHPQCLQFLEELAKEFPFVSLVTNGIWTTSSGESGSFAENLLALLRKFKNISIQVSAFPDYYKDYAVVMDGVSKFKQRLKEERLQRRIAIETDDRLLEYKMLDLGRASDSKKLREIASRSSGTASCLSSALVSAQTPLRTAVNVLEIRGKFCHPLVDWQGNLHWSESWLCPSFASVYEPFGHIEAKARHWRPCKKCAGWSKAERKAIHDPTYRRGLAILAE